MKQFLFKLINSINNECNLKTNENMEKELIISYYFFLLTQENSFFCKSEFSLNKNRKKQISLRVRFLNIKTKKKNMNWKNTENLKYIIENIFLFPLQIVIIFRDIFTFPLVSEFSIPEKGDGKKSNVLTWSIAFDSREEKKFVTLYMLDCRRWKYGPRI